MLENTTDALIIGLFVVILCVPFITIPFFFRRNKNAVGNFVDSIDNKVTPGINLVVKILSKYKSLIFNRVFTKPKLYLGLIVLVILIIGYAIGFFSQIEFLRKLLGGWPVFMEFVGITLLLLTNFFALIVGVFTFTDKKKLWELTESQCTSEDKLINTLVLYIRYLFAYLLPLIILVSFLISSASSLTNKPELTNVFQYIIKNSFIYGLIILFILIALFRYYVYNHTNLVINNRLSQSLSKSAINNVLILLVTFLLTLTLLNLTIEGYASFLNVEFSKDPPVLYWIMFGASIFAYLVLTYFGPQTKDIIKNIINTVTTKVFKYCDINEISTPDNNTNMQPQATGVTSTDKASWYGRTENTFVEPAPDGNNGDRTNHNALKNLSKQLSKKSSRNLSESLSRKNLSGKKLFGRKSSQI
mgnify:CR=1 FL=1|tara:strand:- start:3664 stop:4911 length:1248 start_codon:yes stop_codon:yes gene_type:complete